MPNATQVCDVGNVLVTRNPQRPHQWLDDARHYLQTPYMPGVVEVLRTLTQAAGTERTWLLSKCSPETERRTREFLTKRGLHVATGIRRDHVRFCRDRTGADGKAPIILDQLWDRRAPLLVIDDRSQILMEIRTVARERGLDVTGIHLFAFNPDGRELDRYAPEGEGLHVVSDAQQLLTEAFAVLHQRQAPAEPGEEGS